MRVPAQSSQADTLQESRVRGYEIQLKQSAYGATDLKMEKGKQSM